MYRIAIEELYEWKKGNNRKPLIIEGARQVGKTWLMKEFGKEAYRQTVYINFDSNSRMAELFSSDLEISRIIMGLELYSGVKIVPENTLIIFDEVQEVPRALASLKYFYENAPEYHIICAGSLLGIALHHGTSFPVGKVDAKLKRLIKITEQSFFEGIKGLKSGAFVGDISHRIQTFVEKNGFSIVRELVGHGIGKNLHEDPAVPNYGRSGSGPRLSTNSVIAIEPMVNMGERHVVFLSDGWTCKTRDGLPSAHYENTVLITDEGVEILTL